MAAISCILATRNRPAFLAQAIRYWTAQTVWERSELIVVDDSDRDSTELIPSVPNIKYVRLTEATRLGAKLNIGIERSSGSIVQKLDDDDYYHPSFLEKASNALIASTRHDAIAACGTFLVLVPGSLDLRLAQRGPWFAGGTLCFYRTAWEACPFRPVPSAVDTLFLEDHPGLVRIELLDPELYVLVRHGSNTWKTFPKPDAPPVTDYFSQCSTYGKPLRMIVGDENVAFYERVLKSGGEGASGAD